MNKLIDFFIERTKWVNTITIVISIVGLAALLTMKKDLHPAFKFNYVMVSLSYPNASADEIEKLITYPIEEKLRDVTDVEEITSKSKVGSVNITLKFPQSVKNISDKIEEIRALVQTQLRLLPSDIRNFQVTQAGDSQIFLANLGVTGINSESMAHHNFMDSLVLKIKSISGISEVDSSLKPFHIFIKFDREKLNQKRISIAHIRNAVRAELGTNSITHNSVSGKSWLLEFADRPVDLERIKNIDLRNNGMGNRTRIQDVAEVKYEQLKNDRYQFLLDGNPAVEISVFKNEKNDSIKTFELVQKALAEVEKPEGVDVRVLYDGPYFIQQQINVLLSNGLGGLLLVLIVLSLAMGWRTSLMTALGLPISYFGTFLILKLLGVSIDLITLMAMILVVGNLVDDAVIYAERYNQLLSEGIDPKSAASQAAKELVVPVSGTILTIIMAFIPILILDSELSVVFFALPVVVAVSLMLSWFETFFILPNHLQHYVKKPTAEKAGQFFFWLANKYKKVLRHTLRFRYLYGLASILVLAGSLMMASKMPQDFSLSINAPQVELAITFKEEHDFKKLIEVLKPLHESILALPKHELDFVETNLGWIYRQGKVYRGPKYATVRLVLDKNEVDTKTLRATVQAQVNKIVETFKPEEIQELVVLATERGSNDRRTNLSTIEIKGKDQAKFNQAKDEIVALVSSQNKDLEFAKPEHDGPDTFRFVLNHHKLGEYAVNKEELGLQIKALTGTYEILETRSNDRWMNIYMEPMQYSLPSKNNLDQLSIQPYDDGQLVKLSRFGEWASVGFSESIEHKLGERTLKLDFRYDGAKTNEQVVKKNLTELILPVLKKYPNLNIEVVDANEQDKKGREWGLKVVLLAGISIYLILAATLGSFSQPLIVGLPIPFAVIGVIWALQLHGMQLGLMVMLGLIGTMGVAVNDSIVMVHQINLLWKKYGVQSADLVIEGAASRLRAIVLTASCTLIGVFPTAYGLGGESGFTQPLAFSMGWGLTASLLLTLFIIPAMLMVLNDIAGLFSRRKTLKNHHVSGQNKSQLDLQN